MEDIKIIYSQKGINSIYEEIFLINYFNKNVIRKINKTDGVFNIKNNILEILWNNKLNIKEKYIKINKTSNTDTDIDTYFFIEYINSDYNIEYLNQSFNNILTNYIVIVNKNGNDKIILYNNKILKYNENIDIDINNIDKENIYEGTYLYNIDQLTLNNEIYIYNYETNYYYILEHFSEEIQTIQFPINELSLILSFSELDLETVNHIKIDNGKIKLKLMNDIYYSIFEINNMDNIDNMDNMYYNVTEKYNINININHESWNDICIINKYNNYIFRSSNKDEYGTFDIENDNLTIYWEKWDKELFVFDNDKNIYYYKKLTKFYVKHIDWNDNCIINNNNIYRENNNKDNGTYLLENNKLTIYWTKWNPEIFYKIDDIFYFDLNIKYLQYGDYENLIKYSNLNSEFILNISYILNIFSKKIYKLTEFNNQEVGNFYFENEFIYININKTGLNKSNIDQMQIYKFYFINKNNNIIIYDNIYKELIIVQSFNSEETVTINIINNNIETVDKSKKGTYKLDNKQSTLIIFWNFIQKSEIYKLSNNKYYLNIFREIILEDDNSRIKYNVNNIENILYNDTTKIKYLEDNNIFYIIKNNCLLKYISTNNKEVYHLINS